LMFQRLVRFNVGIESGSLHALLTAAARARRRWIVCPRAVCTETQMDENASDMSPTGDAATTHLTAAVRRDDSTAAIVLKGELDLASLPLFTGAVDEALAADCNQITLDWGGLTFIDSSGVGAYVQVFRKSRAAGVPLVLGERSDVVQRVLDLSGVEEALQAEAAEEG